MRKRSILGLNKPFVVRPGNYLLSADSKRSQYAAGVECFMTHSPAVFDESPVLRIFFGPMKWNNTSFPLKDWDVHASK